MTNDNYTTLSNEELVELIRKFNINTKVLNKYLKNNHNELYSEIRKRTSFLDEHSNGKPTSIVERLHCLEHNLTNIPICKNSKCNNEVKWDKSRRIFMPYCSDKCASTDPEFWKRVRNTSMERYGTESPNQSQIVKDRKVCTCVNHFGVENPSQAIEVKDKKANTYVERLGVDNPAKSSIVQDKMKETNIRIRGVENPFQSVEVREKAYQKMEDLYGVRHALQSVVFKKKVVETNNQRFGHDYYTQTEEYHKKAHKPYTNPKYPDMTFGSSWEFLVYDLLIEKHIEFQYQPSISFEYEYDGRIHTYHPDFKVGDNIYEVKGEQFFRINDSTGHEEMFCPYRYPEWSDEYYNWMCGKYEAKHQCMRANNVIIIRDVSIENLRGLFKNYTTYLSQFKHSEHI